MTATNICTDFSGFRWGPPLINKSCKLVCGLPKLKLLYDQDIFLFTWKHCLVMQLKEVTFVDFVNWSRVLHKAVCHSLTVLVIVIPSVLSSDKICL